MAAALAVFFEIVQLRVKWWYGALLVSFLIDISFFSLGYFLAGVTDVRRDHQQIHYQSGEVKCYTGTLTGYFQKKVGRSKAELQVQQVWVDGKWQNCSGRVFLSVLTDSLISEQYLPGDVLLVAASPVPIPANLFPGGFDYARYSSFRQIYRQSFVKQAGVRIVGYDHAYLLHRVSARVRNFGEQAIGKYMMKPQSRAVLSALVLGVKDHLDDELLYSFSATGAMHVLAVSGLHVGILYVIISMLLKPVEKLNRGPWLAAGISLLILWLYAFVTGLSPSVLRSAVMFSVVVIAKVSQRKSNIYNTLAFSAFLLLIFDPFLITSVGFQLSYLAVLGIVFFQPRISHWYEPPNSFIRYLWDLGCVAIAAQLGTFILGLLYFNQFPVYFLLSNLIVIPVSGFLLGGGLLLIVISVLEFLANWVGFALDWVIWAMNELLRIVAYLPFSTIYQIQISAPEASLLCILILLISFFLLSGRRRLLLMAVLSSAIWLQYRFQQPKHSLSAQTSYIYPDRSGSILIDKSFAAASLRSNGPVDRLESSMRFIKPHLLSVGMSGLEIETDSAELIWDDHRVNFIRVWNGLSVLKVKDTRKLPIRAEAFPIDVLLVDRYCKGNARYILKQVRPKYLIFEGLSAPASWKGVAGEAMTKGVEVYFLEKQGIFKITEDLYDPN